ncbi:MAG: DinB family protein [Dehalococcoidia bacterium]
MTEHRYRSGLIARLRTSGTDILWIAEMIPDPLVDEAPDGEWSARQVLGHLRDIEYGIQIARVQAAVLEDNPDFKRFDADAWRTEHRPDEQTFDQILGDFAAGRRSLTAMLDRLDEDDWERPIRSVAFGQSILEVVVERAYVHTLDHLQQLIRLRRAVLRAAE